ncbi:hypothetical protein CG436_15800 [Pantoea ananatis]|jgi:hypothetical protein|nr:hypothetical protein CG433_06740 [Pantoea ananatis]PQL04533.1 hypothetical protein CG434_00985 [Pantoea ananatis]PQL06287.1 hypothetical protein CG436_15800 [Pantoea ananatis]BBL29778.1 hypothetical protein PAFU01_12260 [Pantoea ananatis]
MQDREDCPLYAGLIGVLALNPIYFVRNPFTNKSTKKYKNGVIPTCEAKCELDQVHVFFLVNNQRERHQLPL